MMRLQEVENKLAEMQEQIEKEPQSEQQRLYIEHLKSLKVAYQKERIKALVRKVDDKDYDRVKLFEDLIPKGMYA